MCIFRCVRKIAKSGELRHVWPSVRLHGATRFPLDGCSCNLVFEYLFHKSVEKSQVSLKSDKNNETGTLLEDQCTFLIISRSLRLTIRKVSDKSCRESQNTILCSINFFFENCAVCEITWKNILLLGRPQMTVWHVRIVCRITKATDTHSGLLFHGSVQ